MNFANICRMKRGCIHGLVLGCAIVVTLISTRAQGTIVFNNRLSAIGLDAPVTFRARPSEGPGPDFSAGLYHNGRLIRQSVTTFRDGSANPLLSSYIHGLTVVVPGALPGQENVEVEMRAWLTSAGSYEASSERGSSGPLLIAQLGGGPSPNVPNNLPSSFTGFFIETVPEPSTLVLTILGAAVLGGWRRRRP